MSVNAMEAVKPNGVGSLAFDGTTSLSDLSDYAKSNNLKLGTTAINADDGSVYIMNSKFEFTEI